MAAVVIDLGVHLVGRTTAEMTKTADTIARRGPN
jgi:hypothetical protein